MNQFNRLKFIGLAFAAAMTLRGACPVPTGKNLGGNGVAPYIAMTGTIGTNIKGQYWVVGNGAVNSGTCPVDTSGSSIIQDFGGDLTFTGNWANPCNAGCVAAADTVVFQVERDPNVAAATHSGSFATSKVAFSAGFAGWTSDDVNNGTVNAGCTGGGACITALAAIPLMTLSVDPACGSTYNHATGAGNVCVSFTQPNVTGFSGPGANAAAIITGYEVYQINQVAAPTTGLRSGWGTALTPATAITCLAGTCTGIVTLGPAIPNASRGWLTLALVFENGARTQFVSGNGNSIGGPTATSGLPSRVEVFSTATPRAPAVQVRWTTTNETQIAGFNIFASKTQAGGYVKMNDTQIAAAGSPNTYLQTITRRSFITTLGNTSTVYLKLVTVLKDGTTREVAPTSFALPLPEPGGRGGKGGGRER